MNARRRSGRGPDLRIRLDLRPYVADVDTIREESMSDVEAAGERAIKTLDRFLADLAAAHGMQDESPGMYDSIQFLERQGGRAQSIAARAEQLRATRNALAHNPDLTLRPEAAMRIIDDVDKIIRSAAHTALELARRPPVTVEEGVRATNARDHMLARGYRQLVVVDQSGKLVDLLTYRDIVAIEARHDLDGEGDGTTVREVIGGRDYLAVAPVHRESGVDEIAVALVDDHRAAAVVTENGKTGETPLGVITRGDILRFY